MKKAAIYVLLDRSGSMCSIEKDTVAGLNKFIQEQKKEPGKASLRIVMFDSHDGLCLEVLRNEKDIRDTKKIRQEEFEPRGMTPLLDAMAKTMKDARAEQKKNDRKVIFVVVTDGQENDSRKTTYEDVAKRIQKRKKDDWEFLFLSSDLEAVQQATKDMGIDRRMAAAYAPQRTMKTYDAISQNVGRIRRGKNAAWKDEERVAMAGPAVPDPDLPPAGP